MLYRQNHNGAPTSEEFDKPVVAFRDSNMGCSGLGVGRSVVFDYRGESDDFVVFSDYHLEEARSFDASFKVAVLVEPPAINPTMYQWIMRNHHLFDAVFTYVRDLLSVGPKFRFYPYGTCWIKPEDRQLYKKSRMLSMIVSEKRRTPDQRLRHEIVSKLGDMFDICGRGYRPAPTKRGFLAPYRYTVVIENGVVDAYFTEKIVDACACGTVPVYRGCPSIGEFFDLGAVIQWSSVAELEDILHGLSEEDYESRLSAIQRNVAKATEYAKFTDNLWTAGLDELYEAAVGRGGGSDRQ